MIDLFRSDARGMSKRIFSSVSLTSLMLCLAIVGWWYCSFSATSVVNWGSGELWAAGGKLVMTDQSLNTSPETRFSIRSMHQQAQPAILTASLQSASLGYHAAPMANGAMVRNLVLPMWLVAGAFAFLPFVSIMRHHARQKKEKAKH